MTRFRLLPLAFVSVLALTTPLTLMPQTASAQVDLSITVAPPLLPIYAQPPMPAPDYMWTPGYWSWGPYGYYWVPGTWVEPPQVGLLWTPGWWGWESDHYLWHIGYWGPTIGFYGGVNYGFGYTGSGYYGGHWDHDHFFYNRAVNNFGSVHVTNVYNSPVRITHVTHVSFNGGHGGLTARPSQAQLSAANQHHVDPTSVQTSHQQAAAGNHALLASVNRGRPAVAATSHASAFSGAGVVQAHNRATFRPAAATTSANAARPGAATPTHADNAAAPHPDNAAADRANAPAADHANAAHPAATPTHTANTGAAPTHADHTAATPHTQQAAAPAATPHPQEVHTATPHTAPASHPAPVHPASAPAATPHPATAPHPASHPAPAHPASAPAPHPAPASHPAAAPAHPAAPAKPDDSKDDHH